MDGLVSVDSKELGIAPNLGKTWGVPSLVRQRMPRVREQSPESKNANQEIGVRGYEARCYPIRIREEELSGCP